MSTKGKRKRRRKRYSSSISLLQEKPEVPQINAVCQILTYLIEVAIPLILLRIILLYFDELKLDDIIASLYGMIIFSTPWS